MHNICCTVEYDGTDFYGFQRQSELVTVQGVIEKALSRLTRAATTIHGAGRTDAGVHARGQVFNFKTETNIPVERWPMALNSRLPDTVVVTGARRVPDDFHARISAGDKVYEYNVRNAPLPSVFTDRFALHVRQPLDVRRMEAAAASLVGRHDFGAFRATGSTPVRSTVRNLTRLDVQQEGPMITMTAQADGFLYHMMRNIVGSLLLVGQGKREPEWLKDVLRSGRRELAGPTAPARGLCLVAVKYC